MSEIHLEHSEGNVMSEPDENPDVIVTGKDLEDIRDYLTRMKKHRFLNEAETGFMKSMTSRSRTSRMVISQKEYNFMLRLIDRAVEAGALPPKKSKKFHSMAKTKPVKSSINKSKIKPTRTVIVK